MSSPAEEALVTLLRWHKLPTPTREATFIEGRKFRADFMWPGLIVEVEGGVYSGGRHTRGIGFESDCEKQNLAVLAGYRYMRVTPRQIDSGDAIRWIEEALRDCDELHADAPVDGCSGCENRAERVNDFYHRA